MADEKPSDIKKLEAEFRALPKGTAESNKAFQAWRKALNEAPVPEAPKAAKKKSTSKR